MIPVSNYKNQLVVVMGLGRTGLSSVQALQAGGANVIAWDDNVQNQTNIPLQPPEQIDWTQVAALILSPGISHLHPVALLAKQYQVPILCDIDLLAQSCPHTHYIGITGTNGKSTTTALLGHLLQAPVGGNIGKPVLELEAHHHTYVLELSSYQLERCPHLHVNTAVWLNITPDHLERHGDLAGYVAAKKHIFTPFGQPQNIAISVDDAESFTVYQELIQDAAKNVIPVSLTRPLEHGIYVANGILIDQEPILNLKKLTNLKGMHNWQNIAMAYAAVRLAGFHFDVEALYQFKGLPHRQEPCGIINDIEFINDSKATNIDSTLKALPYYKNIHLILGGLPKADMLQGIEAFKDHIVFAYLIGQASDMFAKYLSSHGIPFQKCNILETAVQQAFSKAQANHTILLSPACASFDQFKDFEQRGERFKELVQKLAHTQQLKPAISTDPPIDLSKRADGIK